MLDGPVGQLRTKSYRVKSPLISMAFAVSEGYVAVSLDVGLPSEDMVDLEPRDWALLSPGNVNLHDLQNFGSVSLSDATLMAKDLTKNYYGQPPKVLVLEWLFARRETGSYACTAIPFSV